ncbi:hypothetical protein HAX54_008827 [Datura stramonium]|uniref:Uncharacterized protein n=1 Tax=Datura stramonium TaxID=4076 RepID=A0ABS8WV93_DATST|nr:hypothetical protein [Datura stramonium]
MKCQKIQRNLHKELAKKDEAIIDPLGISFMSIPRKPRTKRIARKIVKKDKMFNPLSSWIGYKTPDRKEDSEDSDQTCNNCYSKPIYEIPGPIPDDLDAVPWDIDTIDLDICDV